MKRHLIGMAVVAVVVTPASFLFGGWVLAYIVAAHLAGYAYGLLDA